MFLRKIATWLIKNLIVLLLITLIFSTVALDLPVMVKGVFSDIFLYASPQAQKDIVSKLATSCSSLEGKDASELQQEVSKGPIPFDLSKIGALCKDYSSNKINDREFFFNVIGSAIPDKFELPKTSAFEKYNKIIDILTKNKLIYFSVLAVLLILLYVLIMDTKLFILTLSGISFSLGSFIVVPYFIILAYERFAGINTTPILSSILQGSFSFDIKAIISVILLMVLRTYTTFILALGTSLLGIGIAGKIYSWRLSRQTKATTPTEKEAIKEDKKKSKKEQTPKSRKDDDEFDEAYRHRDRTTKEILDGLDEMHKKKTKEKSENKE